MKHFSVIVIVLLLAAATMSLASASKPFPRLELDDISGEWIGECEYGNVFRLVLTADGTGRLGYVKPQRPDDDVTVYELTQLEFDGVKIRITLEHEEWGAMVLVGIAREEWMELRIKGLYGRGKPHLWLVRSTAWEGVLDRLRSNMRDDA